MKLPALLPKELAFAASAHNENELFGLVTGNLEKSLEFLTSALDDDAWSENHQDFLRRYIRWLSDLYYNGQIGGDFIKLVAEIFHERTSTVFPLMHYDFKLKVNGKEIETNALMLSTSSPYFYSRVQQQAEKKEREFKVNTKEPGIEEKLLGFVLKGTKEMWKEERASLKAILKLASAWEMKEIAVEAEFLLKQYVDSDNAMDSLIEAYTNGWKELALTSTYKYNENEMGLKLHLDKTGLLVAEFFDFKMLTTMEVYKKISPYVSICKFTGSLAHEPEYAEVIIKTKKLIGLDFSGTEQGPENIEDFPINLERIILSRASWLSDLRAEILFMRCPALRYIDLADNYWLTIETLSVIAKMKNVHFLNLSGFKRLTDADISVLTFKTLPFEHLNLSYCKKLSSKAIAEVLRDAPRLQVLDLSNTAADDKSVAEATRLTQLVEIDFTNTQVSGKAIENLRRQKPRLNLAS